MVLQNPGSVMHNVVGVLFNRFVQKKSSIFCYQWYCLTHYLELYQIPAVARCLHTYPLKWMLFVLFLLICANSPMDNNIALVLGFRRNTPEEGVPLPAGTRQDGATQFIAARLPQGV